MSHHHYYDPARSETPDEALDRMILKLLDPSIPEWYRPQVLTTIDVIAKMIKKVEYDAPGAFDARCRDFTDWIPELVEGN